MKNKFLLLLSFFLFSEISIASHNNTQITQEAKRKPSIKQISIGVAKAIIAITQDPFSSESIWDQNFLKKETEISETIRKFINGEYAAKAKELKFSHSTKEEAVKILLDNGFQKREPEGRVDGLLGKGKDREFQDAGEIYVHEDGSMIRLKEASTRRHLRPQAYLVKAVLKNKSGPVTWQNEAFKVSKEGYPIPKGPKQKQGLIIHAPNSSGADEDKGWVDLIMEEVHIDIKP